MKMLRSAGLFAAVLAVVGVSACAPTVTPITQVPHSPEPVASVEAAMPTADPSVVSPQPTEGSPPAALALDLSDIVLAPEAPPSGTGHDYTVEGAPVLTRPVVSGRDSGFLSLDGFTAGRYTAFSGESGILLSLGLLFDTVGNAGRAFDLYLDEFRSDTGYGVGGRGVEAGLGEQGTCAEFDNPSLGDLHEYACLWCHGPLVLVAGGTLEPDTVDSIAAGMDARVSSALQP
jgi:hypothetical protein